MVLTSPLLPMTLLSIPTSTAEVQTRDIFPSAEGSALGSFPHAASIRGLFEYRRPDLVTPVLALLCCA